MGQLATLGVGGADTASDTYLAPYFEHHPAWASYDAVSGVTFTRYQNSSYIGGGLAGQSGVGDAESGDSESWYVWLAAGTYTLKELHQRGPNSAIAELFLDSTSLGTYDGYVAVADFNNVTTITSIVVASDGNYTFKIAANGKNASSADYLLLPQWFSFIRTGA